MIDPQKVRLPRCLRSRAACGSSFFWLVPPSGLAASLKPVANPYTMPVAASRAISIAKFIATYLLKLIRGPRYRPIGDALFRGHKVFYRIHKQVSLFFAHCFVT